VAQKSAIEDYKSTRIRCRSVADKPAPCAAWRRTCCKQVRWTLSVINFPPS